MSTIQRADPAVLSKSPPAVELLDQMVSEVEIKKTILHETISAGEAGQILESGRTICPRPGELKGPVARFPTSVQLQRCPIGAGGAWHAHVTPDELRNPRNSLPDIATVVFDHLDVIGVVGTDSEEYFVGASDRDAMRREFNRALGVEARSFEGFMDALKNGHVQPSDGQRRVRNAFSDFFYDFNTGYNDLRNRVSAINPDVRLNQVEYSEIELRLFYTDLGHGPGQRFRNKARGCGHNAETVLSAAVPEEINIREVAIGSAIGTIASKMVERAVFGE